MMHSSDIHRSNDRYDLDRFLQAQQNSYAQALSEIRSGRKRTHWMWFIFPQFAGLGSSSTARHYAIRSVEEAQAYLEHELLGARLPECADAALCVEGRTAKDIFGSPDDGKPRSCATLFARISPSDSVFERLLEKYYEGECDSRTLELMGTAARYCPDVM